MRFTIYSRPGGIGQRVRIGDFQTSFPQLCGLLRNGDYIATTTPLTRCPLLRLVLDDRVDRGHDMANFMLHMGQLHGTMPYGTHVSLCHDALFALFGETIPSEFYIYRVSKKRTKK